jgi:hypothetical protein
MISLSENNQEHINPMIYTITFLHYSDMCHSQKRIAITHRRCQKEFRADFILIIVQL